MIDLFRGKTLVKATTVASIGAGNTALSMRPPQGAVWIMHGLTMWVGVGPRAAAQFWVDVDSPAGVSLNPDLAALAALTSWTWGAPATGAGSYFLSGGPIKVTYLAYPTFLWTALGAGENGYMRALVQEYAGLVEAY
jgi:hypothetical protein